MKLLVWWSSIWIPLWANSRLYRVCLDFTSFAKEIEWFTSRLSELGGMLEIISFYKTNLLLLKLCIIKHSARCGNLDTFSLIFNNSGKICVQSPLMVRKDSEEMICPRICWIVPELGTWGISLFYSSCSLKAH